VPPTPVIVTEVMLALNVDEPVEVFVISVIKPLSDATGPEKVVRAIIILHTELSLLVLYASAGAV
jgi:hypothetical protein